MFDPDFRDFGLEAEHPNGGVFEDKEIQLREATIKGFEACI